MRVEVQGLTLLLMVLLITAYLVVRMWDCYRKKYVKKSFVRNCFADVEHKDNVFEMVSFHDESPMVSLLNQSIITYY